MGAVVVRPAHHIFICRAQVKRDVQTGCHALRSPVALVAVVDKSHIPGKLSVSANSSSLPWTLCLHLLAKSLLFLWKADVRLPAALLCRCPAPQAFCREAEMSSATFGNKLYLLLLHPCPPLDHYLPHQKYASVNSVSSWGPAYMCTPVRQHVKSVKSMCTKDQRCSEVLTVNQPDLCLLA